MQATIFSAILKVYFCVQPRDHCQILAHGTSTRNASALGPDSACQGDTACSAVKMLYVLVYLLSPPILLSYAPLYSCIKLRSCRARYAWSRVRSCMMNEAAVQEMCSGNPLTRPSWPLPAGPALCYRPSRFPWPRYQPPRAQPRLLSAVSS
jgi:hypothetical protein